MPAAVSGMKECSKCGETKEVSEYYKKKRHKDGLSYHCKKCCKKRHQINKDRNNKRTKIYRQTLPAAVYEIKNKITGKAYVGQSKSYPARWNRHKSCLRRGVHRNLSLQSDYDEYGLDVLEFNVITEYPCYITGMILFEAETIEILKRVRAKQELYNNTIPQDDGRTFIDVDYTEEEFTKIIENSIKLDMTMTEFVCKVIHDFNLSHLPQNNSETKEE